MIGTLGSPPTRKYACSECGARPSTVRIAATSACPITCPPNTRCQRSCGLRPRNRFTSSCSRLSTSSMAWTAAADMAFSRVKPEEAATPPRKSSRAALLRRDEAAVPIRREIIRMDRVGEGARLHESVRGAWRAAADRRHLDCSAKIAGLADRLHSVEAGETSVVDLVELAEQPMPHAR